MADNYLERREEELRNVPRGGGVHQFKNLDSLLAKSGRTMGSAFDADPAYKAVAPACRGFAPACLGFAPDPAYKVHPLQMNALLGALALVFPGADASVEGSVLVLGGMDEFSLGIAFQSVRLKALEMGLDAYAEKRPENLRITVFKPL